MELKDFIGKTVISAETGRRFVLRRIMAPYIIVETESPNELGCHPCYRFDTGTTDDPISSGRLCFADAALTEPFRTAYHNHIHSKDGYYEEYGYWMRKD